MSIIGIILAVFGALFGLALDEGRGFLLGALLGYLLGASFEFQRRLNRLSGALELLRDQMDATPHAPATAVSPAVASEPPRAVAPSEQEWNPLPTNPEPAQSAERVPEHDFPARELLQPASERQPDAFEAAIHQLSGHIRSFFTDGNVVVRVGLIVLFFGVGFLIKYASERNFFPIELRLTAIGLAAIAMLVFGWRLREKRRTYALLIEGGAIGVMYLTVFAAAKYYLLLPPGLALGVMLALVGLSAALAVLQDAKSLAVFGATGGFLAPVLVATGGGSHVMLFSYYALLNAGILGIAWFRAWRQLNVLGFAFTFVIGALWGQRYYQPDYFASVEPFLILFFLMYVAIAILFATRQPPQLKGYVDGSLVFGVPIVGFALQVALVHDSRHEMALSALALGLFYALLAGSLWKRSAEGLRLLVEAFLALAVVFGTVAIPLALDGRWTAAAWAAEGAALVWVGVRQQRLLARLFGLLMQVLAGLSFLNALGWATQGQWAVFNGLFLGCVLISLAGLFSAYYLQRRAAELRVYERALVLPVFLWGVAWWLGAGMREIDHFVLSSYRLHALLLFLTLSGWVMNGLGPRLAWPLLRTPAIGLLPSAAVLLLVEWLDRHHGHPFGDAGYLAWSVWLAVQYRLLRTGEAWWIGTIYRASHVVAFWMLTILAAWEVQWLVNEAIAGSATWGFIAWSVLPAAIALFVIDRRGLFEWPLGQLRDLYVGSGLLPVMLFLWSWLAIASLTHAGDASPLPYVPLLNPLDLAEAFAVLAMVRWSLAVRAIERSPLASWPPATPFYAIGLAGFLWFNGMLARTVYHWGGVAYTPEAMFASLVFQAATSIAWTVLALGAMVAANRFGKRPLWFAGAGLIAVVVAKLFLVDLSNTGTMARIVSFLAVGGLLLVVGYFSPLPPRGEKREGGA
jgi:uncharacterized membrane protein